jgi:hypothetical protein
VHALRRGLSKRAQWGPRVVVFGGLYYYIYREGAVSHALCAYRRVSSLLCAHTHGELLSLCARSVKFLSFMQPRVQAWRAY